MFDFVLIAFFDGCSINISEEKIKLIYFGIKAAMALKEADSSLMLPAVDYLLNYHSRENWRTNEIFQSPMHSNGTLDIWVGDLVNTNDADTNNCFLVSRFYHKTVSGSSVVFFAGFPVYSTDNVFCGPQFRSNFIISCEQVEVFVTSVTCILRKNDGYLFSLDSGLILYDSNASTPFRACSRGSLID
ncbi:hypothetical protein BD408DRAFT_427415 [Parasitella parasitica]|nr:hypothetical protein BD408DRAFT_427415 [Parasitella parasitica]